MFALGFSIATPAIPVFAKSFDTGFAVASLVIVMHALGGLISAVPSVFLIDYIGRRPVLLIGPLLMALSSILTALAGSFAQLLAYRVVVGAAMEMWRQSRLAMVAEWIAWPQDHHGAWIRVDGGRIMFSRCWRRLTLGFFLLHWRFSLGAMRPDGDPRQHAGVRLAEDSRLEGIAGFD